MWQNHFRQVISPVISPHFGMCVCVGGGGGGGLRCQQIVQHHYLSLVQGFVRVPWGSLNKFESIGQ
jgi:hypothetical protein